MGLLSKLFGKDDPSVITVDEALERFADGAEMVDVREKHEFRRGHVPGARHINLSSLPTNTRRLPKGRPLLVICASGARSKRGAAILHDNGFEAYSVKGGVKAWKKAGGDFQ